MLGKEKKPLTSIFCPQIVTDMKRSIPLPFRFHPPCFQMWIKVERVENSFVTTYILSPE